MIPILIPSFSQMKPLLTAVQMEKGCSFRFLRALDILNRRNLRLDVLSSGPPVEVKDKNTAETYINTLNDYLLPELRAVPGHMVFQQDNAAIHKTAAVVAFMNENNVTGIVLNVKY
jgi:hypothetical protein